MNSRTLLAVAAVAATVAVVAFFVLNGEPSGSRNERVPDRSEIPTGPITASAGQGGASRTDPPSAAATQGVRGSLGNQIEALFEKLVAGKGTPAEIAALRNALEKADPREAMAAALEFLRTGRDARTGGTFVVGEDGRLAQAPTLRVMLLDLLGAFSRQLKTDDAATYARTVLETKSSADEWSIALRNVAWGDSFAKNYLSGKARELLAHPPWRQNPTAGMLEAFDVAVFVQDPTLIPPLEENLKSEQAALQRAAAIALDRLAERAPLQVMSYLNANPGVMAERPFVRADYFAKADLAQPAQRQAIEFYLGRADVSHDEKAKLLDALTTPASFVAEGLLSAPLPEPNDRARQNAFANAARDWLGQNRFPQLRAEILEVQRRLRQE